ncbi:MAG: S41 family peptidase, partial [Duodenibacillus sp.]|nr:S41 family peptidase [Duodenibacillus sp.]
AFKDMEESTTGEFGGLGIEVTKDPAGVRVVSPIDDTPAARAGIRAGDLIVKIDGKATADLTLNENVKMMRGKPKTAAVLSVARKGEASPLTFTIVRDIIKIRSVKTKELSGGIGYIRITQFQDRTTADVAEALHKLSASGHMKGLVLDLRNNPGGLLNAAIGVSAAFLPPGVTVVSTRGREKSSERKFLARLRDYATKRNPEDVISKLPPAVKAVPLVVLVNPASASASEIVSGALQDHKRAVVMGTRTFGKGSVQTILPLKMDKDDTAGVKITTARYYTPSGRTIQARGITPDIAVADTPDGNSPAFNLREADLARHIEVKESAEDKAARKAREEEEELSDGKTPKLQYAFGDEKDFPLQQACAHLLGKKVVTHADIIARKKAERAARKKAGEEAPKAPEDKKAAP